MATIYIDNRPYEVSEGKDLLKVCLSLGFDIPYFCWHPALGAVGACRQCAVKQFKDEDDTHGRLIMSCMTPAADGMRIAVNDPKVKEFHAEVVEWLMTSHPHDCPVCDEGGECHLQDMTVLTGHTYRRFRFDKRTFRNQDLGPFINHEMNRCITCYRCVRFYHDYAGGTDLHALASKNHVYFGRHEDGTLENEFSGNLVEVCPTGVFTDKTLKEHYTRKWDLQSAPSVCVHCGVGCNTTPGERYGRLRRIHNRYNGQVNGYFLCDRGRYGYDFVNSERRILRPARRSGVSSSTDMDDGAALEQIGGLLQGRRVVGLGSPRASLEANVLLRRLVGEERFFSGVAPGEQACMSAIHRALRDGPARAPSVREVEDADAVLVLGEDVTNTAPRAALALRQASRRPALAYAESLGVPAWKDVTVREIAPGRSAPFFVAAPGATRLDDLASRTCRLAPGEIARLGFAVAHALDEKAPPVQDLSPELQAVAGEIAEALGAARRPLVVSGTGCASTPVIEAAANVAQALCRDGRAAGLYYAVPECNSMGLAMMGAPGLEEALALIEGGEADAVVALENDLYQRVPRARLDALLPNMRHLVVIDHLQHDTAERADFVLPAATFAEGSGTMVSAEGRAQRFFQVFVPEHGSVRESWRWLRDLMGALGHEEARRWQSLDDALALVAADFPSLAPMVQAAPGAGFRMAGQRIPRQAARYSGRTAMDADRTIHEPAPEEDPDAPLAFSMEGYTGEPPAALITHPWAPHWNSVQAFNKFQEEVGGALHGGDPGVRLLEPAATVKRRYASQVPAPFAPAGGRCLVVPRGHIFGSEELSVHAPALAERVPGPYLGISGDDAAARGIVDGEEVELHTDAGMHRLPAALIPALPRGVLALPRLPGVDALPTTCWARLRRAADA